MRVLIVLGVLLVLSSWYVPAGNISDGSVTYVSSDTLMLDTLATEEPPDFFVLAEDSLKKLALDIIRPYEDSARLANNALFTAYLLEVLLEEGSMHHPFDSLITVSMLQPPDSSFRIITWYVPLQGEQFRYFGYIKTTEPSYGNKKMYVLEEDAGIDDAEPDGLFTHERWLGSYYYELVANTGEGRDHYVLLGWRADDSMTRKRIIEPFYLGDNGPVFGAPVFDLSEMTAARDPGRSAVRNGVGRMPPVVNNQRQLAIDIEPLSNNEQPYRIVFTYSSRVSMGLLYDEHSPGGSSESLPMIVFDRLVPMQESMKGQYRYYVPAGDVFDALIFRDGLWVIVRDVDARGKK